MHMAREICGLAEIETLPMRVLRLLVWFLLFVIATFSWVVLIEHGPDSFWEGSRIELENIQSTLARGLRSGR
jgi:hypothetical protein